MPSNVERIFNYQQRLFINSTLGYTIHSFDVQHGKQEELLITGLSTPENLSHIEYAVGLGLMMRSNMTQDPAGLRE
jgi:hypothetical protein